MCNCEICGCDYPQINEGIDFISYQNWDGKTNNYM